MANKTLSDILVAEFDESFVQGMRNRMATSYYKYGSAADNVLQYDYLVSLRQRLCKFEETHNTEWLIDAANMAMIIHMHREKLGLYFEATDSDKSPGLIRK